MTGRCKKSECFTNALNEVVVVAMVVDCLQVCSAGYFTTSPNTNTNTNTSLLCGVLLLDNKSKHYIDSTSKNENIANSKIRLVAE